MRNESRNNNNNPKNKRRCKKKKKQKGGKIREKEINRELNSSCIMKKWMKKGKSINKIEWM